MKNFRKLLLVTGLAAALSAGFGPAVAGAEEIKIGGGAAPIENIFKKVEEGMSPIEAAIKGSNEIFFAVISISITLAAVFF